MSQIITAINSMITNADKISGIIESNQVFYFLYDKKYKWSIHEYTSNDFAQSLEFNLRFYPGNETLEDIRSTPKSTRGNISYTTEEYNTGEARKSFMELFRTVKERAYGIDAVLEEIIDKDNPFI